VVRLLPVLGMSVPVNVVHVAGSTCKRHGGGFYGLCSRNISWWEAAMSTAFAVCHTTWMKPERLSREDCVAATSHAG
jgi:hypothetical protein